MDDAQLQTIWQQRQLNERVIPISQPLTSFLKYTLAKRLRQLRNLAEVWDELVPQDIREHTALEGLNRGVLTVMVDSSPHRFRLQTLLAGGLLREIRQRFVGPLDRVRLVPGQFYAVDVSGNPRYSF